MMEIGLEWSLSKELAVRIMEEVQMEQTLKIIQ